MNAESVICTLEESILSIGDIVTISPIASQKYSISFFKSTCPVCSSKNTAAKCSNCGVKINKTDCKNCTFIQTKSNLKCEICQDNLLTLETLILQSLSEYEDICRIVARRESEEDSEKRIRGGGLSSIFNNLEIKNSNQEESLTAAFNDFEALIGKAKEMVILAENISKKLDTNSDTFETNDIKNFNLYLVNLGISQPVTKESSGDTFTTDLSSELSTFLTSLKNAPLSPFVGIIPLPDLYCLFNRARGVSLVSPQDLYRAACLLKAPFSLKRYDSGLITVIDVKREEEIEEDVVKMVAESGVFVGVVDVGVRVGVSVVVAKEMAELKGLLARDETGDGVFFYRNEFLDKWEMETIEESLYFRQADESEPEDEKVVSVATNEAMDVDVMDIVAPKAFKVINQTNDLFTPSISEIDHDILSTYAKKHWKDHSTVSFDSSFVDKIWNEDLLGSGFSNRKVMLLEYSQYLENYLWPNFDQTSTFKHILSIVLLINEKARQKLVDVWTVLTKDKPTFDILFHKVLELILKPTFNEESDPTTGSNFTDSDQIRKFLLVFLINGVNELGNAVLRTNFLKIASIGCWVGLVDEDSRLRLLAPYRTLLKRWAKEQKEFDKADKPTKSILKLQRTFFSSLIINFLETLSSIQTTPETITTSYKNKIQYCERFLEFLIDLESQIPTRRYFNDLLHDHLVLSISHASPLAKRGQQSLKQLNQNAILQDPECSGVLFCNLLNRLDYYARFEVDAVGTALSKVDVQRLHYERFKGLQRVAFGDEFKEVESLRNFALMNVGALDGRGKLESVLLGWDENVLMRVCVLVGIRVNKFYGGSSDELKVSLLVDALVSKYSKRLSQIEIVNVTSLYPDESILLDDSIVPATTFFNNDHCLAIPKLNLQFLTTFDYLLRNFQLFRLESSHEVRRDIEDVAKRLKPRYILESESTVFAGWSRMGVKIEKFSVVQIGQPKLGESKPSFVKADVTFNISSYSDQIKSEWDSLRPTDSIFFLSVQKLNEAYEKIERDLTSIESCQVNGVKYCRGAEILNLIGDDGKPIMEFNSPISSNFKQNEAKNNDDSYQPPDGPLEIARKKPLRTYRVSLDVNQYMRDVSLIESGKMDDLYGGPSFGEGGLNVVVRRKAKENNFRAILETIRDLIRSSDIVVPEWFNSVLLGFGDPGAAHYKALEEENIERTIDFRDTFLNWEHLVNSFPGYNIVAVDKDFKHVKKQFSPPYILTFPESMYSKLSDPKSAGGKSNGSKRKANDGDSVLVQTYNIPSMGPYPEDVVRKNQLEFTATQVEAIVSGSSQGLTMIVGPPGTGKTDVAVQIISNLYHNHPNQHIILITHSNQALNQLFEKIAALDIDSRHLLRLGHGEEELEIETGNEQHGWGKFGRVNKFLEKRLFLLGEVDRLALSLQIPGAHGNSCETAGYFFSFQVKVIWNSFLQKLEALEGDEESKKKQLEEIFPFGLFFANAPNPIFSVNGDFESYLDSVQGSFRHIQKMFLEIEEIRPFELLRTSKDRSNYLLVKEAKIIAMTCTHAALKRRELVRLGFRYDTVVMEEAAQILEVETFIPLLLQSPDTTSATEAPKSRLKRIILIGDHHQLPPVVQNSALQRYGNMEQSLFTRLVKLGVPTVQLDQQGRCRPSLAELFRWNYQSLGDLDILSSLSDGQVNLFAHPNPGFLYDFQVINVPNFANKGEVETMPHFYQNLGEAEYVVATFMYMRLHGYPANKITILTTYNGQKELIKDVLRNRCSWNPLFGNPAKVSTVDRFQGQENDYILLSLVRTKAIGHLRDVRRLIVAMSRARLGLYVFCRVMLFTNCVELGPAFEVLLDGKPDDQKLMLVKGEKYGDAVPDREIFEENSKANMSAAKKQAKKKGKKASKSSKTVSAENLLVVEDVGELGRFVAQWTQEQIEWMKLQRAQEVVDLEEAIENDTK